MASRATQLGFAQDTFLVQELAPALIVVLGGVTSESFAATPLQVVTDRCVTESPEVLHHGGTQALHGDFFAEKAPS